MYIRRPLQSVERVGVRGSKPKGLVDHMLESSGDSADHTLNPHTLQLTGTFMTDTTILDHAGVLLSNLRATQLSFKFAPRSPQAIWPSAFCPMLGPGKRANHTIGVAKMREFRALGPHEPSQDLQRPSQDLSRPSQTPPCTL